MIGDIALINARGKKGIVNVAGQRVKTLDFSTTAYTHAAMLLGTYRAVHAKPAPNHIEFTVIHELLPPQEQWSIWRHRLLAEKLNGDQKSNYQFLWHAELYVGERYNNPVRLRSKEHHSFCSELIGKVYSHFGLPFPDSPEHLMPITIAKTVQEGSEWREVTDEYQNVLRVDPRYHQLHDPSNTEGARNAQEALNEAKEEAKMYAAFAEPMEELQRFNRWAVVRHQNGCRVWRLNNSGGRRAFSSGALEWLLLLLHDEVNVRLVDFFRSGSE